MSLDMVLNYLSTGMLPYLVVQNKLPNIRDFLTNIFTLQVRS